MILLCLARFKLYPSVSFYAVYSSLIQTILFRKFHIKYIGNFNAKVSRTPDFDLFGGDQVLNADLECQYHRFLKNIAPQSDKLMYAASANWAKAELSDVWKKNTKDILSTFKAIGIREVYGQQLLQHLCPDKDIDITIDPVLLLSIEDYNSILPRKKYLKKSTLLCYLLHCSHETLHLDVLKQIAEKLDVQLKIIGIQDTQCYVPSQYGILPSPVDFLRAFRDADYVITNSFHGSVFSVLFEKQWVTIPQNDQNAEIKNIRQTEFLSSLQCLDRFVPDITVDGIVCSLKRSINWNKTGKQISEFRKISSNWLLNNLKNNET